MVVGHPPFKRADMKDFWYKNFIFHETEKFWDSHER